ncbi:MAG: 50S ribosomal protein L17 [bacterium]|nr:50S ribosomal protein L17 [bacterium]
MRHGKKFNHLGRKTAHRKAMLSNMACSLIEHKRINTTVAKAKALRGYVEPLITKSKNDTTHSRRTVFGYLQNKEAVAELFREVAPKVADRPGGYTRIIRTGYRLGDNAEMCMIELVDFNELYSNEGKKKTTRRSRRGGGGGGAQAAGEATEVTETTEDTATEAEAPAEEAKVEAPAEEAPAEEAPAAEAKAEEAPKAESTDESSDDDAEKTEDK